MVVIQINLIMITNINLKKYYNIIYIYYVMDYYITSILNNIPNNIIDYYKNVVFKDYKVNNAVINFIITEWLIQTYKLYGIFAIDTLSILHYGWKYHYLFNEQAINSIYNTYTKNNNIKIYIPSFILLNN
jgi:hypothetical protein